MDIGRCGRHVFDHWSPFVNCNQQLQVPRIQSLTVVLRWTRQTHRTFQSRGSKTRQLERLGPRERTVVLSGAWHTERPS